MLDIFPQVTHMPKRSATLTRGKAGLRYTVPHQHIPSKGKQTGQKKESGLALEITYWLADLVTNPRTLLFYLPDSVSKAEALGT